MARASKQSCPSRARDRARHEADVLEAALRLFSTRGFGATTIAEVATEAGFSVATLYNLFGSKEAILERLVATHLDAFSAAVESAVSAVRAPREKLVASVFARARYCEKERAFFALFSETYSSVPPGHGERCPARMERAVRGEVERLERIFREMPHPRLDAPTRALAFYGATRAFIVERILRAAKPTRAAQLQALVDGLLDGLV